MANGQTEGDAKKHILWVRLYLECGLDESNGQTEGDDSSKDYLVPYGGAIHDWYIICLVAMMERNTRR